MSAFEQLPVPRLDLVVEQWEEAVSVVEEVAQPHRMKLQPLR